MKGLINHRASRVRRFYKDRNPDKIIKPNFLIVGTMKGGTSILYDFITMHPNIARATQKEIHYFSLNYDKGRDWYLKHFTENPGGITGEASPTYFDMAGNSSIPHLIKSYNPDMKILLIVRDQLKEPYLISITCVKSIK